MASSTATAPLFAAALLSLALPAAAQWDTLCAGASGGPYSAWNETRCPSATATCCPSGFNPSGVGCCPFANAVCCPGSQFACCPAGSTCTLAEGSGYDARYNCTAAGGGRSVVAGAADGVGVVLVDEGVDQGDRLGFGSGFPPA